MEYTSKPPLLIPDDQVIHPGTTFQAQDLLPAICVSCQDAARVALGQRYGCSSCALKDVDPLKAEVTVADIGNFVMDYAKGDVLVRNSLRNALG